MKTHRFGKKIRPHSTKAIKHQMLTMALENEIRALPAGAVLQRDLSPAIAALKELWENAKMESPQTRFASEAT